MLTSEWINVEKRKPEAMKPIVIASGEYMAVGWYAPPRTVRPEDYSFDLDCGAGTAVEYDNETGVCYLAEQWGVDSILTDAFFNVDKVTHWMELPPLPGEGADKC